MTTEERLESLEKKLVATRLALLVASLVAALCFVAARNYIIGTHEIIRARAFVAVDEKGNSRAILHVGTDGPALFMVDENGKLIWRVPQSL